LSSRRAYHACTVQGNNLVVAGGYNGTAELNTVEQLNLA
jgi:deoxycytidylate deaminase